MSLQVVVHIEAELLQIEDRALLSLELVECKQGALFSWNTLLAKWIAHSGESESTHSLLPSFLLGNSQLRKILTSCGSTVSHISKNANHAADIVSDSGRLVYTVHTFGRHSSRAMGTGPFTRYTTNKYLGERVRK